MIAEHSVFSMHAKKTLFSSLYDVTQKPFWKWFKILIFSMIYFYNNVGALVTFLPKEMTSSCKHIYRIICFMVSSFFSHVQLHFTIQIHQKPASSDAVNCAVEIYSFRWMKMVKKIYNFLITILTLLLTMLCLTLVQVIQCCKFQNNNNKHSINHENFVPDMERFDEREKTLHPETILKWLRFTWVFNQIHKRKVLLIAVYVCVSFISASLSILTLLSGNISKNSIDDSMIHC